MASVFMCGVEDLLFSGSRFVWTVTVAALRRWYAARLRACRQALRAWCGLRDVYQVKISRSSPWVLLKNSIVPPDGHVLARLPDSPVRAPRVRRRASSRSRGSRSPAAEMLGRFTIPVRADVRRCFQTAALHVCLHFRVWGTYFLC